MFKDSEAMATIAVTDLKAARRFYEGKLGLEPAGAAQEDMVAYRSGGATVMLYKSQFAGTNKATCATWTIRGGIEQLVQELRGKGVVFEHYDMPGTDRQGDVHVQGGRKVAWCKDPDGNILCLAQG